MTECPADLVLVSASPRRHAILNRLGIPFVVSDHHFDEESVKGRDISPPQLAEVIAINKVQSTIPFLNLRKNQPILSGDTLVFTPQHCFGKPKSRSEAEAMLAEYSGSVHYVASAIACFSFARGYISSRISISAVHVKKLTREEICTYLDTNEWRDVAGGYRIQERGGFFVSKIEGSYSGIEGLPIFELYEILREHNFSLK